MQLSGPIAGSKISAETLKMLNLYLIDRKLFFKSTKFLPVRKGGGGQLGESTTERVAAHPV